MVFPPDVKGLGVKEKDLLISGKKDDQGSIEDGEWIACVLNWHKYQSLKAKGGVKWIGQKEINKINKHKIK